MLLALTHADRASAGVTGTAPRGSQTMDASIVKVSMIRGKADEDHEPRHRPQERDAKGTKKHSRSCFGRQKPHPHRPEAPPADSPVGSDGGVGP